MFFSNFRSSGSSSGSDSSGSSSDSSDSSYSSSSSAEMRRRKGSSPLNRKDLKEALKLGSSKLKLASLKTSQAVAAAASAVVAKKIERSSTMAGKKRTASMDSPPGLDKLSKAAKKTSGNRREELLKQLKAVEDAIARKRSKV